MDFEGDRLHLRFKDSYGVGYEEIDDYLEGLPVTERAARIIEASYRNTRHKRALPAHP